MDVKLRNKIISALRKVSYSHSPRNKVKGRAKLDICLYKCQLCDILIYDGKSDERYEEYVAEHGLVLYDRINLDHIDPVVDPDVGFVDWNNYITRLYPDESGWQAICSTCHDKKTSEESKRRRLQKKRKKV